MDSQPGSALGVHIPGLVGLGLVLGGLYNSFTSRDDSLLEPPKREQSDHDRYRLARWGCFGGVGMMALGLFTLVREAS